MIRIAVTGGMGSGKATVAGMFARLGAIAIDADQLARDAIAPGTERRRRVVETFGGGILKEDGSLDRRALAGIVFGDRDKLSRLSLIIHPPVIEEIGRRLDAAEAAGKYTAAVVDVPLLYEAKMEGGFDKVIVVACPRDEQVRRCMHRDGLTREEVERRLEMQISMEEKMQRADFVIDNGGSPEETERQVRELWKKLTGGKE